MPISTSDNIQQALVRQLRTNAALKSGLAGGMHEGFAPKKVPYPLLVYQLIFAPYRYTWGSVMLLTGFDVKIFHTDSVAARNLDALATTTLNDAALNVTGQSTLICRRTSDLASPDVDEEGKKVYMVGGTYEIWTDQPLPATQLFAFSADAVLA